MTGAQTCLRAVQSRLEAQLATAVQAKPTQAWPIAHSAEPVHCTQRRPAVSHTLPCGVQSRSLVQVVAATHAPLVHTKPSSQSMGARQVTH